MREKLTKLRRLVGKMEHGVQLLAEIREGIANQTTFMMQSASLLGDIDRKIVGVPEHRLSPPVTCVWFPSRKSSGRGSKSTMFPP